MAGTIKALAAEARWRGLWGTVRALKMNKMGTMHCFVDKDYFGNKYFENKTETYGRHRWVEYSEDRNFDSLRIPPDWHAWLHHNTDVVPTKRPLPQPEYHVAAAGNPTGTSDAYVPPHHRLSKHFSGPSKEKYETWNPSAPSAAPSSVPEPAKSAKDVLDLK